MGDVPPIATQTLSVASSDFFFPFLAGIAIMSFASGICTLRFGGLPKWLGWVAIVIGIVTVTPVGFVGFLAAFIWVLVVSITLFLREGQAATPASPTAPAA